METTIKAKRKGDALITLRQNNNNHQVEVINMNRAAEKLTGYSTDELVGQNIGAFLPERINESFEDYIEYDDPSYDFASIARKIPNFQVKNKRGSDISVSLKVFYLTADSSNSQEYEILMRDIRLIKKIDELKNEIAAEVSDNTEPSLATLMHAYNTAYKFISEDPIEVTFATFGIDNYIRLSEQDEMTTTKVIKTISKTINDTCRDEDIAAYIKDGIIGVVLLDCGTDNAQDVINRVIDKISETPISLYDGSQFNTSMTVCYTQLKADDKPNDVFKSCVDQTLRIQEVGGNSINELFEDDDSYYIDDEELDT
jgi:PAS domain S-box-containing protein